MRERYILQQLHKDLHELRRKYFASVPREGTHLAEIFMNVLSLTRSIDIKIKNIELIERNMEFKFQTNKEDSK